MMLYPLILVIKLIRIVAQELQKILDNGWKYKSKQDGLKSLRLLIYCIEPILLSSYETLFNWNYISAKYRNTLINKSSNGYWPHKWTASITLQTWNGCGWTLCARAVKHYILLMNIMYFCQLYRQINRLLFLPNLHTKHLLHLWWQAALHQL